MYDNIIVISEYDHTANTNTGCSKRLETVQIIQKNKNGYVSDETVEVGRVTGMCDVFA